MGGPNPHLIHAVNAFRPERTNSAAVHDPHTRVFCTPYPHLPQRRRSVHTRKTLHSIFLRLNLERCQFPQTTYVTVSRTAASTPLVPTAPPCRSSA